MPAIVLLPTYASPLEHTLGEKHISENEFLQGRKGGGYTIVIADTLVQIELGIYVLTVRPSEAGSKDVVIVDADVLGGTVKGHFRGTRAVKLHLEGGQF